MAWHLWRQSLREELAQEDDEDTAEPGNAHPAPAVAEGVNKLSLWGSPWKRMCCPTRCRRIRC